MYIDFNHLSDYDKSLLTKAIKECGFGGEEQITRIDFSTEIPLDGSYLMNETLVDDNFVFTPLGNRNLGGSCYLRLKADGDSEPVFIGMAKDSSSVPWFGMPGAINCVTIWFDGKQVFYRITQSADIAVVPATPFSYYIDFFIPNKVTIIFDNPLSPMPIPEGASFTVTSNGKEISVSEVFVDNATLTLMLTENIVLPNMGFVNYTPSVNNPLTDAQGYSVAAFSNLEVYVAD